MGIRNFGKCSAVLMLCLIASPERMGAAAKAGPIEAAMAREAERLAALQNTPAAAAAGWARVAALQPGAEVVIVVRGGGELRRRFVSADETTMLVSTAAAQSPEKIARPEVVEDRVSGERRGSLAAGLVAGGLTFALAGLPIGLDIAMNEVCQPACGWAKTKVALSLVALPVGAGYVAYKAFGRRRDLVIYSDR